MQRDFPLPAIKCDAGRHGRHRLVKKREIREMLNLPFEMMADGLLEIENNLFFQTVGARAS